MKEKGFDGFVNFVKGIIPDDEIEKYYDLTMNDYVIAKYRYYKMRKYEAAIIMYEWDNICKKLNNKK